MDQNERKHSSVDVGGLLDSPGLRGQKAPSMKSAEGRTTRPAGDYRDYVMDTEQHRSLFYWKFHDFLHSVLTDIWNISSQTASFQTIPPKPRLVTHITNARESRESAEKSFFLGKMINGILKLSAPAALRSDDMHAKLWDCRVRVHPLSLSLSALPLPVCLHQEKKQKQHKKNHLNHDGTLQLSFSSHVQ